MKTALLLDIDGTLTPAREKLKKEMADALSELLVPFHVAAGSHLELVKPQFLDPLNEFGFKKNFNGFLNNGASHFLCSYDPEYNIELLDEFNFKEYLGDEFYNQMIGVINKVIESESFKLPSQCSVIGPQIVDRNSMLNFAPIGRPSGDLSEEAIRNRKAYFKFDSESGHRDEILAYLNDKLVRLIEEKKLLILKGGQTSFDFVIEGKDKTNGFLTLQKQGVEEVHFLGDALHENGNDWVITRFRKNWKGADPCPLKAIEVKNWKDTIQKFIDNKWLP